MEKTFRDSSMQLPLRFETKPTYSSEEFVKSDGNALALVTVESWPQWLSYGVVFWGPPKVGKTHLAHIFQQKSRGVFLDKGSLENLEEFERLVIPGRSYILEDSYPWILDHEQSLFHLCNLVKERGSFLLMTAEQPPIGWQVQLPDLKSRLSFFPAIPVHDPDDDLLEAILVKKMSERQIDLDPIVRRYILTHTERSAGALIHLLEVLDEASLAHQKKITIPLVKKVIKFLDY